MGKLARFFALALAAGFASADLATEVEAQQNQSLLWGPYKPNLYFGVRPRLPEGLWTGLMWGKVDTYEEIQSGFRYTCEQGADMHGYGWDEYDARTGGVQSIHDQVNLVDITTSFVKIPGGDKGGSWAARVKGTLRDGAPADTKLMVHYYIAQEGKGELKPDSEGTESGIEGEVTFSGQSEGLGDYKISIKNLEGKHPVSTHEKWSARRADTTVVRSQTLPPEIIWQGTPVVFREIQDAVTEVRDETENLDDAPPPWQVYRMKHKPGPANVQIVQKVFQGSFEFDVVFSSASAGKDITTVDVTEGIKTNAKSFADRFASVFDVKAPFTDKKYQPFAKGMFSNLLGGVGYFHGGQIIDRSYSPEYEEEDEGFWEEAAKARARKQQQLEGPYELFTSIPSRPFFPRGFLWDEGFHLLLVADYDIDLTLQIIKSWYNTMDKDGWIPREQILGPEALSRVPDEFQVQYPHYANPPTLFLVIEGFMERLRNAKKGVQGDLHTSYLDNPEIGESYLRAIYPLLMKQYAWFRKTQRGEIRAYDREAYSKKEAYRWRGRTETHVLTSGLDDYPRPQPPHPGELHVDLMSWVGLMTKSLLNIAQYLDITDDVAALQKNLEGIRRNLDDLHWSDEEGCYCDATIDDFEEHTLVCHKGYISLFPFLVGLMKPDDPKLGKILSLIGDEAHLFSPHGIRSLSKQDPLYETGENYWRSPVWMPINYMVVSQLYNVATTKGPHQTQARALYSRLRTNLVTTVFKSWEATGFAWEQYHPDTGAGQRTQHFTGWTSLVVKIMAMEDLGRPGKDEL